MDLSFSKCILNTLYPMAILFHLSAGEHVDNPMEFHSYDTHAKFASRIEESLSKRLSSGIVFGLKNAMIPREELMTEMTEGKYMLLQLLQALESGDKVYSNVIMESISQGETTDGEEMYSWVSRSFKFDRNSIYKLLKNYVKWYARQTRQNYIPGVMLLLARDYSLVEMLSVNSDSEIIKWLLSSKLHLRHKDENVTRTLWNRGGQNFLKDVFNRQSTNDTKRTYLDHVVRNGDIHTLIYLLENNVTDLLDVVISCLKQNRTTVMTVFLPKLLEYNLRPESVDSLLQTVLKDGSYDILIKIIQNGFPINKADFEGVTLLYKAIEYKNDKMIKFLIKAGANVNFTGECNKSLLHIAVERKRADVAQKLIDLGGYMYARDCNGLTPLHWAVKTDDEEMVIMLVENGYDLNVRSTDGSTVIYYAISNGTEAMLQYLVNLGCKINVVNKAMVTPLFLALTLRKREDVNFLVDRGANYNFTTPEGNTLMHLSAMKGSLSALHVLRTLGLDIDQKNKAGETPLYKAVQSNKPDFVKVFVQSGADYKNKTKNGDSLLHVAVTSGSTAALKALLKLKMKADTEGHGRATPMERAVRTDDPASMLVLKMHGADLHRALSYSYNSSLLHDAARYGRDRAAVWLMDNGIPPDVVDTYGWTPLHWAVMKGHLSTVLTLLKYKARVNVTNTDGCTPLYLAAYKGHAEILQKLINSGADPNIKNKIGFAAMHIAALKGHHGIVHELLNYDKPDVNIRTNSGNTPLHMATWKGHLSVVEELLMYPADVNATTKAGYAPLHVSIIFGHYLITRELLNNNADPRAKTVTGHTPMSLAKQWKRKEIIKVLRKYIV